MRCVLHVIWDAGAVYIECCAAEAVGFLMTCRVKDVIGLISFVFFLLWAIVAFISSHEATYSSSICCWEYVVMLKGPGRMGQEEISSQASPVWNISGRKRPAWFGPNKMLFMFSQNARPDHMRSYVAIYHSERNSLYCNIFHFYRKI